MLLLSAFFLLATTTPVLGHPHTCRADGTCEASCQFPASLCSSSSKKNEDIYRFGGTAQAYKPNQPHKTQICNPDDFATSRHRVASWPYSISNRQAPPPRLLVTLHLWSCVAKEAAAANKNAACCSCQPWEIVDNNSAITTTVQAWQARPDGSGYSSLIPGQQDGDCRAQQTFDAHDGATTTSISFETVAPGSTGSLGGLGPYRWDLPPYGPPVLHLLVTTTNTTTTTDPKIIHTHAPTLVNVPILPHPTTRLSQTFRGSDWRGAAWVQDHHAAAKEQAFHISSWDDAKDSIELQVDVFLTRKTTTTTTTTDDDEATTTAKSNHLCRSWVYGLPASFFLEPIAVCAPSMLDFFAL